VYPAEAVYDEQMRASGDPHFQPPIMEELKAEARKRGLWNLFHPHPGTGAGLTNLEYAPLRRRRRLPPGSPDLYTGPMLSGASSWVKASE
jgi:hypothetical protein